MINSSTIQFRRAAFPLLMAIFIDGMGLGLFTPILNSLLTVPKTGFFSHPVSAEMRDFLFGAVISIFMLCWFFGAAYLGDLSDAIGRKKTLLICLIGSSIGYIFSGIAVVGHSLGLLIFGRVIAGFTAGSQSIAQAAMIDISPDDLKARNIALILLAASLGFVCGPLCGTLFSDHHLFSFFNYAMPLYFAALVSFINAVLIYRYFSETFTATRAVHWRLHHAIGIFVSAFRHERVRYLSFILLLFLLAWSSYYSFISMYLVQRYGFSSPSVGIFMAVMAGGFGIGFGWLVNYLMHHFSPKPIIFYALLISALFTGLTALSPWPWIPFLSTPIIGMSVAVAYSILLTLFSNQVDQTLQGWVMGITGAIMAMAFVITGITSSLLAQLQVSLPIGFACLFLLFSAAAMRYLVLPLQNVSNADHSTLTPQNK